MHSHAGAWEREISVKIILRGYNIGFQIWAFYESINGQAKKSDFFSGRGVFSLDPPFNG
jgi:hypothetical protein